GAGPVGGRTGARERCGSCWRECGRPGSIHARGAFRPYSRAAVPRGRAAECRRSQSCAGRSPYALLLLARTLTARTRLGRGARVLRGSSRSADRTARAGLSSDDPGAPHPGAARPGTREPEPRCRRHWWRLERLEPSAAVSPDIPLLPLPNAGYGPVPLLELYAP